MKIIAGEFRGRGISMPKAVRPTSDKVREALFEILKEKVKGSSFADLYCGSGAVGIEALSRGAREVAFVDNSFKCITALKKNLLLLGISDSDFIHIYKMDALRAIETFEKSRRSFDIIFLDPPYYKEMAKNTLIAISDCDILARNTLVVAESYKKEHIPERIGCLQKVRTSKYGDTKLEFFEYTD